MADSANYQFLRNLVEAYERNYSKKSKNTSQTAIGKVWEKMREDFPATDELG